MRIFSFDQKNVDLLSAQAESMLKALAQKHGLEVSCSRGKYSDGSFTTEYTFKVLQEDGVPADWNVRALRVGLEADSYGKTFLYRGELHKVVDIIPRYRQWYPVICEKVKAGVKLKFPAEEFGEPQFLSFRFGSA